MIRVLSFQRLVARGVERDQIEDWCRKESRSLTVNGGDLVLSRVLGKYLMYSQGSDSALTPHLAMNGIWEPWVSMAIARHVKPGMKCFDIGACYGYYTLLLADLVGEGGEVDAYEPVLESHELLNSNVGLNGFTERVNMHLAAVSNVPGQCVIQRATRGHTGLYNAGGAQTLDWDPVLTRGTEYASRVKPKPAVVDFVKIDVEGNERDVWSAIADCFGESTTVCMEFTPGKHAQPRLFLEEIASCGFKLGTVGHDGTPRPTSAEEALVPDTGDFRTLWVTRGEF